MPYNTIDISAYLDQILNERYANNMRQAIYNAISGANTNSLNAKELVDEIIDAKEDYERTAAVVELLEQAMVDKIDFDDTLNDGHAIATQAAFKDIATKLLLKKLYSISFASNFLYQGSIGQTALVIKPYANILYLITEKDGLWVSKFDKDIGGTWGDLANSNDMTAVKYEELTGNRFDNATDERKIYKITYSATDYLVGNIGDEAQWRLANFDASPGTNDATLQIRKKVSGTWSAWFDVADSSIIAEIAEARGSYPTLKDKLDAIDSTGGKMGYVDVPNPSGTIDAFDDCTTPGIIYRVFYQGMRYICFVNSATNVQYRFSGYGLQKRYYDRSLEEWSTEWVSVCLDYTDSTSSTLTSSGLNSYATQEHKLYTLKLASDVLYTGCPSGIVLVYMLAGGKKRILIFENGMTFTQSRVAVGMSWDSPIKAELAPGVVGWNNLAESLAVKLGETEESADTAWDYIDSTGGNYKIPTASLVKQWIKRHRGMNLVEYVDMQTSFDTKSELVSYNFEVGKNYIATLGSGVLYTGSPSQKVIIIPYSQLSFLIISYRDGILFAYAPAPSSSPSSWTIFKQDEAYPKYLEVESNNSPTVFDNNTTKGIIYSTSITNASITNRFLFFTTAGNQINSMQFRFRSTKMGGFPVEYRCYTTNGWESSFTPLVGNINFAQFSTTLQNRIIDIENRLTALENAT